MAKPNYSYQKRQRELAKKQKKEEKLKQREAARASSTGPEAGGEPAPADSAAENGGTTERQPDG